MVIAPAQVDILDVFDDDFRSERSAAVQHDEFAAVPVRQHISTIRVNISESTSHLRDWE